nr:MAG TPA: hypothetical protein [Caudoviricetes sp.]
MTGHLPASLAEDVLLVRVWHSLDLVVNAYVQIADVEVVVRVHRPITGANERISLRDKVLRDGRDGAVDSVIEKGLGLRLGIVNEFSFRDFKDPSSDGRYGNISLRLNRIIAFPGICFFGGFRHVLHLLPLGLPSNGGGRSLLTELLVAALEGADLFSHALLKCAIIFRTSDEADGSANSRTRHESYNMSPHRGSPSV